MGQDNLRDVNKSSPPSGRRSSRWRLTTLAVIVVLIIVGVILALKLGGRATPVLDLGG